MSALRVAELLSEIIDQSSLSKKEISERANITRQTLYRLMTAGVAEAKLSTVIGVCHALKINPVDVINVYCGRKNSL